MKISSFRLVALSSFVAALAVAAYDGLVGPLIKFWQDSFAPSVFDIELHATARQSSVGETIDRTQPFRAFAARARGHDEWIGDGFDSGASGGHMLLA